MKKNKFDLSENVRVLLDVPEKLRCLTEQGTPEEMQEYLLDFNEYVECLSCDVGDITFERDWAQHFCASYEKGVERLKRKVEELSDTTVTKYDYMRSEAKWLGERQKARDFAQRLKKFEWKPLDDITKLSAGTYGFIDATGTNYYGAMGDCVYSDLSNHRHINLSWVDEHAVACTETFYLCEEDGKPLSSRLKFPVKYRKMHDYITKEEWDRHHESKLMKAVRAVPLMTAGNHADSWNNTTEPRDGLLSQIANIADTSETDTAFSINTLKYNDHIPEGVKTLIPFKWANNPSVSVQLANTQIKDTLNAAHEGFVAQKRVNDSHKDLPHVNGTGIEGLDSNGHTKIHSASQMANLPKGYYELIGIKDGHYVTAIKKGDVFTTQSFRCDGTLSNAVYHVNEMPIHFQNYKLLHEVLA